MKASAENPIYRAYIITEDWKYSVYEVTSSISMSEQEKQIAQSVTLSLADVEVDGARLSSLIKPRNRVIIKADDGKKNDEVFRGYVWNISPKESLKDRELSIKCYDNLIYWQESEDSDFFEEGKSTDSIAKSVASKWGISLTYKYVSITHEKLVLRGAIADFLTADVLDTAQKQTGVKYYIRSVKDNVTIGIAGTNATVYTISGSQNATELRRYITMNGLTTQVVIMGQISDDAKTPIEATVRGDTDEYGTLQKILILDEDTTLDAAKTEAKNIIKEDGTPKWEHDIKASDIPWIRKGDRVKLAIGTLKGLYLVKSIEREISNKGKTMTMTVVAV